MPDEQAEWIGLIAGNWRFPLLFAENARRLGYRVSAVALTGEADPSLEKVVDRIHWIALGQLRRLIKAFKQDGVRQAVMVGGVKKTHLFSDIRPDLRSLALLRRVSVRKDDSLLRAIASELEDEGIRIRESTFGLDGLLVEEGTLTRRAPTKREWRDIEFGWESPVNESHSRRRYRRRIPRPAPCPGVCGARRSPARGRRGCGQGAGGCDRWPAWLPGRDRLPRAADRRGCRERGDADAPAPPNCAELSGGRAPCARGVADDGDCGGSARPGGRRVGLRREAAGRAPRAGQ